MKKVTYLLALVFALTLMSFSCSKDEDDPIVPQKTLEQQYPDWTSLSWVSTTKDGDEVQYPQLKMKIVGDLVSITATAYSDVNQTEISATETFDEVELTGQTVTFHKSADGYDTSNDYDLNYERVENTFIVTTIPNPNNLEYILKIN